MARPEEGAEDTRRRINLEELTPQTAALAQQLADARLLVTGRDPDSGEETIEVAHEALIRGWQQLREWLNSDREFLLWRQRLRTLADIWDGSGRSEGRAAARYAPAGSAGAFAGRTDDLNALESAFIRESEVAAERAEQATEAARQRELEQERALASPSAAGLKKGPARRSDWSLNRTAARLAALLAVSLVIALVAVTTAVIFWRQAQENTGATTTETVQRRALAPGSQGAQGEVRCPGCRREVGEAATADSRLEAGSEDARD